MPKNSTPRRFEVSTFGVDEALQGFSSDPFAPFTYSTGPGLRIPKVLSGDTTPDARPRYLFLLASREISDGVTRIRGIRQGLTIGVDASGTANREYPFLMPVTTPYWRFIDGNVSWHLVREPITNKVLSQPLTNAPNLRFQDSNNPAMLYASGTTWSAASCNPVTGAPLQYNIGLQTYVPPNITNFWQPIAGLGNFKDLRFPWQGLGATSNIIDELVEGTCRISLYASVLQTNPSTRLKPSLPAAGSIYSLGFPPEEAFLASLPGGEGVAGPPIYWSVFGSILFEDEDQKVGHL